MAYGYRDVKYLLLKIHQHCGLLNPRLCIPDQSDHRFRSN
jgi:hypothetical protein